MNQKVIVVSDGDDVAKDAVNIVGKKLNCRTISVSAGNPTFLSGSTLSQLIDMAPKGPVIVMFDDNGHPGKGHGETALESLYSHKNIEIIGALAVASSTQCKTGIEVDFSITKDCKKLIVL
jgi:stage V sporulation protein AE